MEVPAILKLFPPGHKFKRNDLAQVYELIEQNHIEGYLFHQILATNELLFIYKLNEKNSNT